MIELVMETISTGTAKTVIVHLSIFPHKKKKSTFEVLQCIGKRSKYLMKVYQKTSCHRVIHLLRPELMLMISVITAVQCLDNISLG